MIALLVSGQALGASIQIFPAPRELGQSSGALSLSSGWRVDVGKECGSGLEHAVERFHERLEAHTGLSRILGAESRAAVNIDLGCDSATPEFGFDPRHEMYSIVADAAGVSIRAARPVGVMRALETVVQLVDRDHEGFFLAFVEIDDAPRFAWRGLLLDPSRHWLPAESVHQTLEAMATVKLNVLHWHLTDDQGFRIESKRYPQLHQQGSDGDFYSQDQVRQILEHANRLGIRVVPEFDVPGHTGSWLIGHPELAAKPGPHRAVRAYGVQDTVMDPTKQEVFDLLDGLFAEMAQLFPDPVVHIGGDEVNGVWWNSSDSIQAEMRRLGLADQHALQNRFNHMITPMLNRHGKRLMGWAEIQASGLPGDPIIHVWNDTETLAAAVNNGYDAVFSFGYYLDLAYPASSYYAVDPMSFADDVEDATKILGGEACMWGELVTPETLNALLWPSAAAVAERLWSDPSKLSPETLYPRLDRVLYELDLIGVNPKEDLRRMRARLVSSSNRSPRTLEALERFANVLQLPRHYLRHVLRDVNQLAPLNTLADTLAPESATVREMMESIDSGDFATLAERLSSLATLDHDLAETFPAGQVERPILESVVWLAGVGQDAIDHLEAGSEFSREESDRLLAALEDLPGPEETIVHAAARGERITPEMRAEFAKRRGQVAIDIALVDPVRRLIEMASGD